MKLFYEASHKETLPSVLFVTILLVSWHYNHRQDKANIKIKKVLTFKKKIVIIIQTY